jgi:hypothetical protein
MGGRSETEAEMILALSVRGFEIIFEARYLLY